ncbi:hypothetical protein SUGI_1019510 [Cryptomeria japonica]|nr:hypothetical protein SUGI_1019510 [Cryptomeria japonica]
MHEREAEMAHQTDPFIALPGGYGTMEELLEMITWSQLGIQDKPVFYLTQLQDHLCRSQEIYDEETEQRKRQSNEGQNLLPGVVEQFTYLIGHTAAMPYCAFGRDKI